MIRSTIIWLMAGWFALWAMPALAESVVQQCGQQYQAAKAAGTLNGMTWTEYRTDCTARLKAQPAAVAAAPAETPAAAAASSPGAAVAPAAPSGTGMPGASTKAPPSAGRAAMLTRQRQCGAEWRANKATLVAQTPGLKWPQYWSQCNTRLKAAAH